MEERRNELGKIRKQKIEGIIIRSRARCIDEGEKTSRYFCNLENRNFISKGISQLELNDDSLIDNIEDIVGEAKSFYEGLYSSREHILKKCDLDEFNLDDLYKLSNEEPDLLGGPVTRDELLKCLKKSKNNKSPGSDGYTYEFYKFF